MGRLLVCMLIGSILLAIGIYISTLLTPLWIIVGASFAVIGGTLMGVSAHFLPKPIRK